MECLSPSIVLLSTAVQEARTGARVCVYVRMRAYMYGVHVSTYTYTLTHVAVGIAVFWCVV